MSGPEAQHTPGGVLPLFVAVSGPGEGKLVAGLADFADRLTVARRPADMVELLAAAEAGAGRMAVVSDDFPGLDRNSVRRLQVAGLAVVALSRDAERMLALGVESVCDPVAPVEEVVAALLRSHDAPPADSAAPSSDASPLPDDVAGRPGALVAVWGPQGSPGKTTMAVNLAAELTYLGARVLLIDADSYAASIGPTLGLLDDAPSLAAACRLAARGTLTAGGLSELSSRVSPGFEVLTGISQASRWPELKAASLELVFEHSRQVADVILVDCAAGLEADEELSFDTAAPRRNAATLEALKAADLVLAVAGADPIGLQRLVRGLDELKELVPAEGIRVLVNKVRASAAGSGPEQRIRASLARFASVDDAALSCVPDDREACDRALLRGLCLAEVSKNSPARLALRLLAARLAGELGVIVQQASGGSRGGGRRRSEPGRTGHGRRAESRRRAGVRAAGGTG